MGFTDKLAVADGITVSLNCGFCNQPALPSHVCGKRYLRDPQVVYIVADGDRYHVSTQSGDERYSIDRETFERGYSEL